MTPIVTIRRRCVCCVRPDCGRIAIVDRAGYCLLCAADAAGMPDASLREMRVLLPGADALKAMGDVLGVRG